jgi:hypothetical protein
MQLFHPHTGDIILCHDYSDYEGSDKDNFFEWLDDNEYSTHTPLAPLPSHTVTPIPDPPTTAPMLDETSIPSIIIQVLNTKWMDRGVKPLDPDILDLLTKIMEIPSVLY